MTGAQSLIASLEAAGVDTVFGIPGGAILPAYDPMLDSTLIRHILVRHEQGAGHAAEGFALATGRVGVCMATSGPGATNLVTPIADAHMDSVPIVAITGQVPSSAIGTDAFQEADIRGITMPITKHNYLVTDPAEIPRTVAEAFHIAGSGRPGPVLIDVSKDALQAPTTFTWPTQLDLPGYRPTTRPHAKQVREAARVLTASRRPVLYVGGGVIRARAWDELRRLAELTGAPVVTTLTARGAFPDSHPHHLGMPGMHGTVAAVTALQKSDLIVALGARFDDRVTGKLSSFAPEAAVVHADIDPAEISKNRPADVPIVGDVREVLQEMNRQLAAAKERPDAEAVKAWWGQIEQWKERDCLRYDRTASIIKPQHVVEKLYEVTKGELILTSDVGQHQMWAAQFYKFDRPRRWLNSGGLGTMGVGLPYALGAKLAFPDAQVACITGEASILMCIQELSTAKQYRLPVKVVNLNNRYMGMVRQWQEFFHGNRYSESYMDALPDFVKLAESFGHVGMRIDQPADVEPALREAFKRKDDLVFMDFITDQTENVFPMVPGGKGLSEMILV
jgi:acetolactate synthase-1/2/3 large subunit